MTTPTFTIRDATVEDASAIAHAQVSAWHAAYEGIVDQDYLDNYTVEMRTDRWRTILTEDSLPGALTLVLDAADVGVCAFVSIATARDDDFEEGELVALYAHPDTWGKKYGHSLHAAAIHHLTQRRHRAAILWVLEENTRARRFYEAHGWSLDGARKDARFNGVAAPMVRMQRPLVREEDDNG